MRPYSFSNILCLLAPCPRSLPISFPDRARKMMHFFKYISSTVKFSSKPAQSLDGTWYFYNNSRHSHNGIRRVLNYAKMYVVTVTCQSDTNSLWNFLIGPRSGLERSKIMNLLISNQKHFFFDQAWIMKANLLSYIYVIAWRIAVNSPTLVRCMYVAFAWITYIFAVDVFAAIVSFTFGIVVVSRKTWLS